MLRERLISRRQLIALPPSPAWTFGAKTLSHSQQEARESHLSSKAVSALTERIRPRKYGMDKTPEGTIEPKPMPLRFDEIKSFIESHHNDWRSMISICRGCGPGTLLEIERYATANGIDVGTHTEDVNSLELLGLSVRALNVMRILTRSDVPTLTQLKEFIDEHPDWRFGLLRARNCGRKTLHEIEVFLAVERPGMNPCSRGCGTRKRQEGCKQDRRSLQQDPWTTHWKPQT